KIWPSSAAMPPWPACVPPYGRESASSKTHSGPMRPIAVSPSPASAASVNRRTTSTSLWDMRAPLLSGFGHRPQRGHISGVAAFLDDPFRHATHGFDGVLGKSRVRAGRIAERHEALGPVQR